ncbi:MAG: SAM-dependent DNA methyltransferase [Candidatus Stahlbacteria bacterium]|nr:SAM-dependent DNA methyltransferase [Candidatus Stahlbacteria bacterium]
MPLKIAQLQAKWNKEKDSYKSQEIGSGVQKFVKEVLECEELFNLHEGKLSTHREKRKNEFICEYKTKHSRQVDVAIFITPEILIPVEIEQYTNISKGVNQLFQYQTDLEKKYGILTDGYTWRFFNNNFYREFTLTQISEESERFLEFWKEYIKPELYYIAFFESIGQIPIFKEEKMPVEPNRHLFFEDITGLINSFKNKLHIEGYFEDLVKKERERKAVEITYAYIIQFILYKTLVDNEFDDFPKEYNDKCQKIYEYLKTNRYKDILGIIDSISAEISKNIYRPFTKEQEFIFQKLYELYRVENKLSDISLWLDIFLFVKKYNFANIQNEIFGYIYENYLKELYEDKKRGQYFTDPTVVNFMLDQIGYTPKQLKNTLHFDRNVSIIDPACGSGTFLYSAVNRLIEAIGYATETVSRKLEKLISESIFGLDIAEFPLYLAEMNILMRMLPMIIHEEYNNTMNQKIKVFLTKDSVAEFTDTNIKNTLNDLDVEYHKNNGQLQIFQKMVSLSYQSFVREEKDMEEMKQSLENLPKCPRRRFDYVIANPPYISYNECCKQGILIFELIKEGRIKLNNIYGVNLHSVPTHHKKYPPKPNIYAFFIAVGWALLKDKGKLCYIIPQTVLSNPDLDVIRYHLAKFTTIEKIIVFNTKMFVRRGLRENKAVPTSSLVFVISRREPDRMHEVEVITYKDPNDNMKVVLENISNGKKIIKRKIPQNKFLQNWRNWNFIKQTKEFLELYDAYQRNTEDMIIYYNHTTAEHRFKSRFYFDIGFILDKKEFKNKLYDNCYELIDFNNFSGYTKFTPNLFYPENRDKIKLTRNSQGYITLEQKYKIVWSIKNPYKYYFTSRNILFYMGKACIVCSDNKNEILYLFSLLNFPITYAILNKELKSEGEKYGLLASITAIKEYVRVPRITESNQIIKDEVIKRTEEMLVLEERILSDFVNFSNIMMQKFNGISVEKDNLILTRGDEKIKLRIKGDIHIAATAIREKVYTKNLLPQKQEISLSELKSLPVIDFDSQKALKDYIDNLVFALYFNIPLHKIGLEEAQLIKDECSRNKFYNLVFP